MVFGSCRVGLGCTVSGALGCAGAGGATTTGGALAGARGAVGGGSGGAEGAALGIVVVGTVTLTVGTTTPVGSTGCRSTTTTAVTTTPTAATDIAVRATARAIPGPNPTGGRSTTMTLVYVDLPSLAIRGCPDSLRGNLSWCDGFSRPSGEHRNEARRAAHVARRRWR